MPGLGARLRARWRALVDAARLHPRQADDSGDDGTASQHADTDVVDLRPRVRMPGPAGSQGPPPEWLDYVMAHDPVWIDGGLGLSSPAFEEAADVPGPTPNVSMLTSGPGDSEPTAERPVAAPWTGRPVRARFVRPPQISDDGTPEPMPLRATSEHPGTPASTRTSAQPPPADPPRSARPLPRLLPRHEPVPADPATTGNQESGRTPDPPIAAVLTDRPPVWPMAVPGPATRPASEPAPGSPPTPADALASGSPAVATAIARTAIARTSRAGHADPTDGPTDGTGHAGPSTLAPPRVTTRRVPGQLTSPTPTYPPGRASVPFADIAPRPVLDPWASASSRAPVIELRRDLDDRPAPADPSVALRWRAIDVDRLGIEQRAL